MDRRGFLKLLGLGVAAAAVSKWVPELAPSVDMNGIPYDCLVVTDVDTARGIITCTGAYANCSNQVSALKELYAGKIEELVYQDNPFLGLVKREANS